MARLSLALLGPLRIALDARPASGFAYNKARALLIYLAVEADRAHQRDALVGLLWPDLPDTAARTNLRQVLTNLRDVIADATATPPFLLITRDTIQLNPSSGYELDMISFTTRLDACATHRHRHLARCRSCAARMQQALAHYRGDFLAEFALGDSAPFDEWALRHREQMHQRALDALVHLADYHERRGDDEPARRYAQRQIELDPWREEAHRQFARAEGEARAVAQICRLVEGLPLAIELAAATLRGRSCASIAVAIETNLSVLTTVLRSIPERHRSMWATFEYSWGLLSDEERLVFPRLSVFRGGFTLEAVASVVLSSELKVLNSSDKDSELKTQNPKLLTTLAALVDKSLLRWDGAARYDMHELVRQYASEKLEQAGEAATTHRQHAIFMLGLVQAIRPQLGGPEHRMLLNQLEAELPNIRAAFAWAGTASEHDLALHLAVALAPFWVERASRGEGEAMLRAALSRPPAGPPIARAWALNALGRLRWSNRARSPETIAMFEESLELFRTLGELNGSAEVLDHLQGLASDRGDLAQATALEEQSLQDSRAVGDAIRVARALQNLADLVFLQGDDTQGNALLDESLALFAERGHHVGLSSGLVVRARVMRRQGETARAMALLVESVSLLRELGPTSHLVWTLRLLGWALLWEGDGVRARGCWRKAWRRVRPQANPENYRLSCAHLGKPRVSAATT